MAGRTSNCPVVGSLTNWKPTGGGRVGISIGIANFKLIAKNIRKNLKINSINYQNVFLHFSWNYHKKHKTILAFSWKSSKIPEIWTVTFSPNVSHSLCRVFIGRKRTKRGDWWQHTSIDSGWSIKITWECRRLRRP